MAVNLNYVTLERFSDVMTKEEQAEATDDEYASGGTISSAGAMRDTRMVKRFLKRAESMVDTYLTNYERPVDPVPMTLEYTVYVVARYMLDDRADGAVSEEIQRSYDNAITWLEDVRDGVIDLGGDTDLQDEDYFGERVGGTFGVAPHNDKSATFRSKPLT